MRGHIRKRGKAYAIAIYLGKDAQGRRRYHWATRATRQQAEEYLISALPQAQAGQAFTETKMSVGAYLQAWVESSRPHWAPQTVASRKQHVRRVTEAFGATPLRHLTGAQVLAFYRQLTPRLSANTIALLHSTVDAALNDAVQQGLLLRNVLAGIRAPRFVRTPMRVWDEEQIQLFLASARRTSRHWLLYALALMTGMRQGELLALRWSDIDALRGAVHVTRTVHYGPGPHRGRSVADFRVPKTRCGIRAISLGAHMLADLRRVRAQRQEDYHALIFPRRKDGGPQRAEVIEHDFARAISAAGVPRIRFHDLRHTHATQLLMMGVPVKVVQERLGHSRASVTLDVYAHVMPTIQREAAQLLERRIWGQRKTAGRLPNTPSKVA